MTQTLVLYVLKISWDICSKQSLSLFPGLMISGGQLFNIPADMEELISTQNSLTLLFEFPIPFSGNIQLHLETEHFVFSTRPSRAFFSLCHQLSATSNTSYGTCFISLGLRVRINDNINQSPQLTYNEY